MIPDHSAAAVTCKRCKRPATVTVNNDICIACHLGRDQVASKQGTK